MNAIGFSTRDDDTPTKHAEYIVTMGESTDNAYDVTSYRLSRIAQAIDMGSALDVNFEVEIWTGSEWVPQVDTCHENDCGPCSEPNDVDYCCDIDTGECDIASYDTEGQWSNTNTNQHLRCDVGGGCL